MGNKSCYVRFSQNPKSNKCWKFQISILTNKKVLFLKKILSIPCNMGSYFFSQQIAPWLPNFPNSQFWFRNEWTLSKSWLIRFLFSTYFIMMIFGIYKILKLLKSVHFKNTIMHSSFDSKLWPFSIIHQLTSKQSQLMYYWKWS